MRLKPAILSILDRGALKGIVDDLAIEEVDRRSADAMRSRLSQSRSVTAEDLLAYLRKNELQAVCEVLGLATKGTRDELVDRLLSNSQGKRKKPSQRRTMSQNAQKELDFNGSQDQQRPGRTLKKPEKLTLARLETKLFKACDILRGNMDASEYKEYIFGMLFLKRLSDQFDMDRDQLRKTYQKQGMRPDLMDRQLGNPDKYDFFVPDKAHWSKIKHLKQSVGSGLNKALAAIEDANAETLENVLKGINFNRRVGQRTMDDSTLVEFIQHFDEIPLSNDDFEFPDLLGAAYEYLIKYFADSAGKKGGEFYTPSEVVRTMVQLIQPQEGMACYDPCAGSGGMLIQSKQYVQETGGNSRNLFLGGQELNGGTWAICKMNMILHGIRSADIRQGDTLKDPQHLDTRGEVRRFDRVIANPPFSQNYARKDMKFAERFHTFMPESGKKADLMFVQHMVASLKVKKLIDEHLVSLGINPKIPPVELLSDRFINEVEKNKSSKAKASEMEHAIRKHCKVHFDEDPAFYADLSEKLEALIQKYRDNWDELYRELFGVRKEAEAGRKEDIAGVIELKNRWASCSPEGNLNFHWKCMMAPPTVLDYIVVHELAHLIHPNHTEPFWHEVDKVMADYGERKEWLRVNGAGMDL